MIEKNIVGVDSVTNDDFEGGYLATKQLIGEGCNRISYFTGDQLLEIFLKRTEGYKKALADNGIVFDSNYIFQIKSNLDAERLAMEKLLNLHNPPNALFSASDFAELGAIQVLKEKGLKIPDDFCVFGFGNEPFTKFMEHSISSVD